MTNQSPLLESLIEDAKKHHLTVRPYPFHPNMARIAGVYIEADRKDPNRLEISGHGSPDDADRIAEFLIFQSEQAYFPAAKEEVWDRYRYCKAQATASSAFGWSTRGWFISWMKYDTGWHLTMWKNRPLSQAA